MSISTEVWVRWPVHNRDMCAATIGVASSNKNPGIAAGVLHFVERDPGSAEQRFAPHRVRDDFVA